MAAVVVVMAVAVAIDRLIDWIFLFLPPPFLHSFITFDISKYIDLCLFTYDVIAYYNFICLHVCEVLMMMRKRRVFFFWRARGGRAGCGEWGVGGGWGGGRENVEKGRKPWKSLIVFNV